MLLVNVLRVDNAVIEKAKVGELLADIVVPCTQTDLWRLRARWPDGRQRLVKGVGFPTERECWMWVRLESEAWMRLLSPNQISAKQNEAHR